VYNTFLQTIYYDGALPTGVIVYPTNNTTITGRTYTVVVRADSTVTAVDFNIQDSVTNYNDIYTGKPTGRGNDTNGNPIYVSATSVTPDATLTAQYPNYPLEFRFVYTNVPASGTGTIAVRLKEFATSVYTNRFTPLTVPVNTASPIYTLQIASPSTNGTVLSYTPNMTYLVQACFDSGLTAKGTNFNLLINGVLQPQNSYFFLASGGNNAYCPGARTILYNWNNPPIGTNLIQVIYTNTPTPVSDTRTFIIAPPLRISGLANNNQLVVWDSAPGVNYQVLATTNLTQPFLPISGIIPGSDTSTFFYDPNPADQKFYEIQMVQ